MPFTLGMFEYGAWIDATELTLRINLYHFTYEKGSLSLRNAVKSEITFLAKFLFSIECFWDLTLFALNKGVVTPYQSGHQGR